MIGVLEDLFCYTETLEDISAVMILRYAAYLPERPPGVLISARWQIRHIVL